MGKEKEWYRDYATHAYQQYAALGYPTRDSYELKIRQEVLRRNAADPSDEIDKKADKAVADKKPLLADIEAVNIVIDALKVSGKSYVIEAIHDVYFVEPKRKPRRGEIHSRVTRCAADRYASTRSVYDWLRVARLMFCQERGMNTSDG